jgi:hypothetical protein
MTIQYNTDRPFFFENKTKAFCVSFITTCDGSCNNGFVVHVNVVCVTHFRTQRHHHHSFRNE